MATTPQVDGETETTEEVAPRRRHVGWAVATGVIAVGSLVAGLVLRIWILQSFTGQTNSDEATTGIMAMNILRGHLPVLVAGNAYGGTLESFIVAPVYAITGASEAWLKGLNVAEWLAAAVLVYFVARLMLSRMPSLMAASVFWLGSGAMLWLSTRAYAGYATGICAYLGAFLVAGRQAQAERPSPGGAFLAGLLAGLAVWLHPMFLALMAPALLVVTWRHRRSLARWLVPVVGGGVLALLPMLVYNVANGWPSLNDPYPQYASITYTQRLQRFVSQLLPRTVGQRDVNGYFGGRLLDGAWILGALSWIVYLAIGVLTIAGLVVLFRRSWPGKVLAVSALVTPFILAFFSALSYYDDGRYGIDFVVFIAIGVVAAVDAALRRVPIARRLALLALPVVWLLLVAIPSTSRIVPAIQRGPDTDLTQLTRALDQAGIDRVRADYWIAYRLDLFSDERIKAAVADTRPGSIRFPYLQQAVAVTDPHKVAWVFFNARPDEQPDPALGLPLDQYDRQVVGPFNVFLPKGDG
jgi:hypothetical protein